MFFLEPKYELTYLWLLGCQIAVQIWPTELKKRLRDHSDPDLTHILEDRWYIMYPIPIVLVYQEYVSWAKAHPENHHKICDTKEDLVQEDNYKCDFYPLMSGVTPQNIILDLLMFFCIQIMKLPGMLLSIPHICHFFSPQMQFLVHFFSTQNCVNRNKTDFATKVRKLQQTQFHNKTA